MLQLSPSEQRLRDASDTDVERWHSLARRGDEEATEMLCCWAYITAHGYYHAKASTEAHLTRHDADELTADFFIEFEKMLPRIRTATRYARRLLHRMLRRYLQREKKRRRREGVQYVDEIQASRDAAAHRPWDNWSDTEWYQYRALIDVLNRSDELTQRVVEARARELTYAEIGRDVMVSEAALRMRMARFYKAVRERYRSLTSGGTAE